jgi:hypothetical protein
VPRRQTKGREIPRRSFPRTRESSFFNHIRGGCKNWMPAHEAVKELASLSCSDSFVVRMGSVIPGR